MATAIPNVMLRSMLGIALGDRASIVEGSLHLPGLHATTTIRRDAYGITYVDASNDDELIKSLADDALANDGYRWDSL
jgi:acyl-homoserine lactone acylase PvdQ